MLARYVVVSEGFQRIRQCPRGTSRTGQGGCQLIQCLPGRYFNGDTCPECPPNTAGGGGRVTGCNPCPEGRPPNATKTECVAQSCQAGKILSGGACVNCLAGQTSTGGTSTTCTNCPAGQTSTAGGGCTNCPANTFSATAGAASCTACPAGQTSTAGASSCSIAGCPAGKYMSGGACVNCPAGTYSPNTGATSIATCLYCPAGTYSPNTGVTSLSACIATGTGYFSGSGAGSRTECPAGFRCPTSNTSPIQCTEGTYSPARQLTCKDCPRGQTSAAGATSASSCFGSSSGRITTNATAVPIGATGAQTARVGNRVSTVVGGATKRFKITSIDYNTNPSGQMVYTLKSSLLECCGVTGVPARSTTFVSNA